MHGSTIDICETRLISLKETPKRGLIGFLNLLEKLFSSNNEITIKIKRYGIKNSQTLILWWFN